MIEIASTKNKKKSEFQIGFEPTTLSDLITKLLETIIQKDFGEFLCCVTQHKFYSNH